MHKKRPKICTCCRVSKAKFYLYQSTKITKARLGFDDRPEHPSVQINSSSPWTHQKTCTIIDFYSFYLGFLALYCFDIEWQIESKSLKCVHNSRPTTHPKDVVISEVIFNLMPFKYELWLTGTREDKLFMKNYKD